MALKLGELVAFLKADDDQFKKGLDGAKKRLEGFGDKAKILGAGIGVAMTAGVVSGMDMGAANDKLAAQLGATGPESARLGKLAGELYADAYGESLDQVNEAIRGVTTNIEGMATASDTQLEGVTSTVLSLAQTFDQDLGATTRAVGKLIKTGLARDASEALDLLTRGFQTGTDEAGDLLDTVSEYSTKFRDIGLSGQQAMGLLSQGLTAGARDADTVADALKEFAIRAIDGSATTKAGFEALGLSGSKMAADIAAGGPKAAAALDLTLDRLRGIKDPVERNAAAVALFGTKAEDLGDALFSLDPSAAVGALGEVEGAAGKMGETLSDNADSRLESFKRKAHQAFVEKLGEAVPHIEKIVGWLGQHKDIIGPLTVGLGILAGIIGTIIGIYKIWTAVQLALNIAMMLNPIGLIIIAVLALIGIIVLIATKTTWFQDMWNAAWGWIKNAAGAAADWVVDKWNAFIGFVTGLPGRVRSAASGLWDGIKDSFRSAINWLIGKWNNFSLTLGGGSVLGIGIPSVTLSTPNIPLLASGGIVPATRGGRLAVLGEGGEDEAVAPLSKLAGMIRDAVNGASARTGAGQGDTHVYVEIDGQQLEGRIVRVVRERDRTLRRRAIAGAGVSI